MVRSEMSSMEEFLRELDVLRPVAALAMTISDNSEPGGSREVFESVLPQLRRAVKEMVEEIGERGLIEFGRILQRLEDRST